MEILRTILNLAGVDAILFIKQNAFYLLHINQ